MKTTHQIGATFSANMVVICEAQVTAVGDNADVGRPAVPMLVFAVISVRLEAFPDERTLRFRHPFLFSHVMTHFSTKFLFIESSTSE